MGEINEEAILHQIEQKCSDASARADAVLLVDDEETVLSLETEVLSSRGFNVLKAHSGPEALKVAAERADEIKLLVTDVRMPRLDGFELAEKLRAVCPEMKVLFISAYADSPELTKSIHDGEVAFLPKPFRPHILVEKVEQLVNGVSN